MKKIVTASIGVIMGMAIVLGLTTDIHTATEDYSVPSTVRPRMNSDKNTQLSKAFLDSWIDAKKYPSDHISEYEENLFVPKSFYDYE